MLGSGSISRTPAEGWGSAATGREPVKCPRHQVTLVDVVLAHQTLLQTLVAVLVLKRLDHVAHVDGVDVTGLILLRIPATERIGVDLEDLDQLLVRLVLDQSRFGRRAFCRCAHAATPLRIVVTLPVDGCAAMDSWRSISRCCSL